MLTSPSGGLPFGLQLSPTGNSMTNREPMPHNSRSYTSLDLSPLVEKIREKVRRGELKKTYLDIAEYITDPDAPFPVKDEDLTEFIDSMRQDAVAANMRRRAAAASMLEVE